MVLVEGYSTTLRRKIQAASCRKIYRGQVQSARMSAVALKIVIVALALAVDVFAVSVGVGVRGVARGVRWRIGITFACAEIGMSLLGAALGLLAGVLIGTVAGYIGFAALMALGAYMMIESRTGFSESSKLDLSRGAGLVLASLAISLDSLGIGFSILYIGVPLPVTLLAIGVASVAATALGLALGGWFGRHVERYAAFAGGVLLVLTGIGCAALKALRI
jgi:manganese efflux pump family protein